MVECTKCNWIGEYDELDEVIENLSPFPVELCPNCGSWKYLNDVKE